MEYNKNLLHNITSILLLKTKVLKDYKDGKTPSFDKHCVDNITYKTKHTSNYTKIKTYLDDFNINYYVFIDKISGLNNINFDKNDYKDPILITKKLNIPQNKDFKTHNLNIFTEKELAINYLSIMGNTVFKLLDKNIMEGLTFAMKRTDKTIFKSNIGDDKEIKIFYNDNIKDIYGVLYEFSNISIGKNFTSRFYINIGTAHSKDL